MIADAFQTGFVLLYAYLIGSVPLAYVLGRVIKGIDIRRYGSGNVGASNAWVHVGKWVIFPLGLFDLFVKGGSPIWIARFAFGLGPEVQAAAGLLAVAAHSWSVFLRFDGGRGVAPAVGVLFAIDPVMPVELIGFTGVGLAGWLVFRSSGLWVGISLLLLPLWSLLAERELVFVLLMAGIVVTVAAKRLLSNKDSRGVGVPLRRQLMQRLLFDRDISSRDEWVYRRPPEARRGV